MAEENPEQADLPVILVLGMHPSGLPKFLPKVVQKFKILSPYDSPTTPIHGFLRTHAQAIRVLLCVSGVEAISINQEILNFLPSLECIVNVGTGVNHIDLTTCKNKGIVITNAGTVFSDDVADSAVGLLLDVLRRISASNRYVRSGLWPIQGEYSLASKVFLSTPSIELL
ncbi:Glyoxylate/hydroxypyruvate reductase HPR3 [Thalictrum thalictroides]|uniref:Glyoxylate/hydroxypyruvate reductase HPR3 n=1 Tax=Thalictrum thalictroides TaxID=46969 RepID=A0A7J6W0Z8_THATH|nr:Glyoxylate/hydroxypyruvate reductase HPR3 [Thalictrum thalictroides]